jgi:hypothetical protein
MEVDELFTGGKHKGNSLVNVWKGESQDLTYLYLKELSELILRKGNKHDKIYSPIFNADTIEKDFKEVFNNAEKINIVCTEEYIIIESSDKKLIENTKNTLLTILKGKFCAHNFGHFQRHFSDIRQELSCELLKINQVVLINEDKFFVKCTQKIQGKIYVAIQIVNREFFMQNDLWEQIKFLSIENRKIQLNCFYPVINCQTFNIEIFKDTNNEHPLSSRVKLEPLTFGENNEVLLTNNGSPIYLKTRIVEGKAYHKLDIDNYPMYEPSLSEGSKKLLRMLGDPSYIEYCLNNWENFYISSADLINLQKHNKPHNIQFDICEIYSNVLKYKVKFTEFEFSFRQSTIIENERKYELIREKVVDQDFPHFEGYDSTEGRGGYDEFNGAFGYDDDTINDAFEGDPSNYWNID